MMKMSTRFFIAAGFSSASTYLHHMIAAVLLANGKGVYANWADSVAAWNVPVTYAIACIAILCLAGESGV